MIGQITLSQSNLLDNISSYQEFIGEDIQIMCIIKGNAYGHGMIEIAQILEAKTNVIFGVVHAREALTLRMSSCKQEIVVLGHTDSNLLTECLMHNVTMTAHSIKSLIQIQKIAQSIEVPAKIHLKFDTGLNRIGFSNSDIEEIYATIGNDQFIEVVGCFSHLADAKNPASLQTQQQYAHFEIIQEKAIKYFPSIKHIHLGASSAGLLFPQTRYKTIRMGILSYGLWPSIETKAAFKHMQPASAFVPKPVLSYQTQVIQMRYLNIGDTVGYGGTYRAYRPMKIAIIPVGYAEGIPRKLSNTGYFLINGQKSQIIGNICMNMTILDITNIDNVEVDTLVTLIGTNQSQEITADQWAVWADTINYEIVTRLPDSIERLTIFTEVYEKSLAQEAI